MNFLKIRITKKWDTITWTIVKILILIVFGREILFGLTMPLGFLSSAFAVAALAKTDKEYGEFSVWAVVAAICYFMAYGLGRGLWLTHHSLVWVIGASLALGLIWGLCSKSKTRTPATSRRRVRVP